MMRQFFLHLPSFKNTAGDKFTSIMGEIEHSNLLLQLYQLTTQSAIATLIMMTSWYCTSTIICKDTLSIHKNETKNEPLALSEEQITIATVSQTGAQKCKEIGSSRNDYVKKNAEQAKIKQRITEFYGTLPNIKPQRHSRLLASIIPTMEWMIYSHMEKLHPKPASLKK